MAIRWVCLKKSYSRTLGCLSVNPPLPPTLVAIQWLVCGFNLSEKWESVRIRSQINMVEFLEIPNIPICIYIPIICPFLVVKSPWYPHHWQTHLPEGSRGPAWSTAQIAQCVWAARHRWAVEPLRPRHYSCDPSVVEAKGQWPRSNLVVPQLACHSFQGVERQTWKIWKWPYLPIFKGKSSNTSAFLGSSSAFFPE